MSFRRSGCLVGALALVLSAIGPVSATTTHNGYLQLSAGSPYAVGTTPNSITTADFNGDGKQDWASANENGSTITVMLGDGAGSFTAAPGSPISVPHVAAVRAGLVNNDGFVDLVAVSGEPATTPEVLYTLTGLGTGAFNAYVTGPTLGTQVGELELGDVTGDSKLDAVFTRINKGADTHDQLVSVLVGSGTGTWSAGTTITEATAVPNAEAYPPSNLGLGDMEGDGDLDVVLPNTYGSDSISVWLNSGTSTFTRAPNTPLSVGASIGGMVLADANSDGLLDVMVAEQNTPNSNIRIFKETASKFDARRRKWSGVVVMMFKRSGRGIVDTRRSHGQTCPERLRAIRSFTSTLTIS